MSNDKDRRSTTDRQEYPTTRVFILRNRMHTILYFNDLSFEKQEELIVAVMKDSLTDYEVVREALEGNVWSVSLTYFEGKK